MIFPAVDGLRGALLCKLHRLKPRVESAIIPIVHLPLSCSPQVRHVNGHILWVTLDDHSASDHSGSDLKVEKGNLHVEESSLPLKFDKRRLALVLQPSDRKDDPLNWPV